MVIEILSAVGDVSDVADATLALCALSSEVTTMAADMCDMLISKERPELLAEMQELGRTSSESTLAYHWAVEQKNAVPSDDGIRN